MASHRQAVEQRHLDELVGVDVFECLFERQIDRRGDLHLPVAARRAHVGELFGLLGVHHEVFVLVVLADDLAGVDLVARFREEHSAILQRVEREGDRWSGQVSFPGGREEDEDVDLLATAVREVREEVGITVDDVTYRGSQPWPFPHSLMIGFRAEYLDGDLVLDETEIADADWYRKDELPQIPPGISIARRLIDDWVAG